MENLNLENRFATAGSSVKVNIGLFQFEEDSNTIVYGPALDLSGYGKNEEEARASFEVAIEEFFRYTLNKKTLVSELKRLGWQVTSLKQKKLRAPALADKIVENDYLAGILNNKQFTKFDKSVAVPC